MAGYYHQIVVHFGHQNSALTKAAQNLKEKWDNNHSTNKCLIINGSNLQNLKFNSDPKGKLRIYILAHGGAGKDYFTADNGQQISLKELAINIANALKGYGNDIPVEINLVSCEAAKGGHKNEKVDTSSAARLNSYLYKKLGYDIPVIARKEKVIVNKSPNLTKTTFSMDLAKEEKDLLDQNDKSWTRHEYKQPGTKMMYQTILGQQIKKDVYYHSLLHKTLEKLKNLLSIKNLTTSQKQILQDWLDEFKYDFHERAAEKLIKKMQDAVDDFQSPIYPAGLPKPNLLALKIAEIVIDGNRIISSKHTIKEIVYTVTPLIQIKEK